MIGDEFKIRNVRWSEQVTGRKPWYKKLRYPVYAIVLFSVFQAGAYYNATKIMDAALPDDNSVVRDIGFVAPVEYRLEVGML